jgi:hypothetical protein
MVTPVSGRLVAASVALLAPILVWSSHACSDMPTEASAIVEPLLAGLGVGQWEQMIVRPGPMRVTSGDSPVGNAEHEPFGGALVIVAYPEDRQYVFPPGAGIEITTRTSDGDVEIFRVPGPRSCGLGVQAPCDRLHLRLRSYEDVYALLPRLQGASARFTRVYTYSLDTMPRGEVRALTGSGDVNELMRQARRWPGVVSVDIIRDGYTLGSAYPRPGFEGAFPVELGSPTRGDGKLQVRAGSVVTIEYRQPDGSLLTGSPMEVS